MDLEKLTFLTKWETIELRIITLVNDIPLQLAPGFAADSKETTVGYLSVLCAITFPFVVLIWIILAFDTLYLDDNPIRALRVRQQNSANLGPYGPEVLVLK